nr:ABC transporter permease [Bacteroidaceae bacterium]
RRISRPAVVIAQWGVAVGLAVMILSVCIILGFKGEIRQKVTGFGGHIQVINYQSLYSAEPQPIVVDGPLQHSLSRMEGVQHVQRFATKTGMLKTEDAFKGIMLRGMAEEFDTTFLHRHLVEGRLPQFRSDTTRMEVALSRQTATQLGLKLGDKVYAYFFSENVKARRFHVVGIYETYLTEFDNTWVFTDLFAVQRLAGWEPDQCTGAELLVTDFSQLDGRTQEVAAVMNRSKDHYSSTYSTHNIMELYPGIFSWLSLLDTNVYVILALMIGLSLFTMTAGLLIIILERTSFIAIMKSLGATNLQLQGIFLHFGAILVGRGLLLGNCLGLGLALLQKYTGLVHLDPATYYVDVVPIEISWPLVVLLNAGTLVITVVVLVLPSLLVSHIEPARVMRFE